MIRAVVAQRLIEPTRRHMNATKQSLTHRVYQAIRRDILTCVLPPGAHVVEGELATRYKVSKTPVREALGFLRQEGLVQVLPRRGYQVASITLNDIITLLDLRLVLEAGAADLAIERASVADLALLGELARASYRRGDKQSEVDFIAANHAFHLKVAELSGNRRIVELVRRTLDELERVFHLGASLRDIANEVAQDHLDLVNAMKSHDAAKAREIVAQQLSHTKANILRAVTRRAGRLTQHVEIAALDGDGDRPRLSASDLRADVKKRARARR